jgi:hypothetical protein
MLTARDEILHLAEIDAPGLSDDFDTIPASEWDQKSHDAWMRAAEDAGLTDPERFDLRCEYFSAVLAYCRETLARQAGIPPLSAG